MATFSAVFAPSTTNATAKVTGLLPSTSSAEIVFNKDAKIVIIAESANTTTGITPGITIKFGQSGMAAADATGFYIPINTYVSFDLSNAWDRVRVFNLDPTVNVNVFFMQLSD